MAFSESLASLMREATKNKSQRKVAQAANVSQTTIGNMVMGRVPSRDVGLVWGGQTAIGSRQERPSEAAVTAGGVSEAHAVGQTAQVAAVVAVQPMKASDPTVWKTKTGKKYHLSGCSSLSKSKIPIKLSKAKAEGLTACKRCKPPK